MSRGDFALVQRDANDARLWRCVCRVGRCRWSQMHPTPQAAYGQMHRHLLMAHSDQPKDLRQEPNQLS
jgi:hypothetical protein